MRLVLHFLCAFMVVTMVSTQPSPTDWKQRTIYQLLTDRFAQTSGNSGGCADIHTYCGGTFQGIINHLDYIQGMGFDAIWISPVITNTPGGYHGFWAQNIFTINSNFGTGSDLLALANAVHSRNMYLMVGAVANHVGPVGYDYSTIVPFNNAQYYHSCSPCPPGCNIDFNANNQNQVELCRLAGLPDLNQSVPFVRTTLVSWIKNLVTQYKLDGIRIDTAPEVPKDFWSEFTAASGVFGIGEVFDGSVQYVAGYQGPIPSVLSYPLYFTLTNVFARQQSMYQLQSVNQQYQQYFKDPSVIGTFLENHDNPRFLNIQSDVQLYKSGLTYTLMCQGIPIIYYGAEQGFNGGADPNNREPLWPTNYNTNSDLYQYIQKLINFRKTQKFQSLDQVQRYADDNFYAFTRGSSILVATTNVGTNGPTVTRTITYQPWTDGTKLCNLFYPTDCITVQNGSFQIVLLHGESKVFYPV